MTCSVISAGVRYSWHAKSKDYEGPHYAMDIISSRYFIFVVLALGWIYSCLTEQTRFLTLEKQRLSSFKIFTSFNL